MTDLCCEMERESFPSLPREPVLDVMNTSSGNTLINWEPSYEDKFVTKTRDQPKPGSLFPRSLWGGEMKDPEVEQKAQYFSERPCSFPDMILD